MTQNAPTQKVDEIDLRQVFGTLRRSAVPILVTVGLVTGSTYYLTKRQAPTYEAVTSAMASYDRVGNTVVSNTLVTAPPLPDGAVEQALRSRRVVQDIDRRVAASGLPADLSAKIAQSLEAELGSGKFARFSVKSKIDAAQRGVYELHALAETPEAARALADAGMNALLAWDTDRALQGVRRSNASLREQLRSLTQRINATPKDSLERQSLIAARGEVLQNLAQVAVLQTAATGTLTLVAEAVAPTRPVSPKPTRNSALAGLLALFLACGGTLLVDAFRRRVNEAQDLLGLGVPLLGQLPLLRRRQLTGGIIEASRAGRLYESVGFLRINILSALAARPAKRFVTSSAHPHEGKSSVTAALAASFAATGQRVLIIDADLRRPTQHKLWNPAAQELVPLMGSVPGRAPATTVAGAYLNPEGAHATRVGPNVDLLPAGQGGRTGTAGILSQPGFRTLLDTWSQGYDVVLIDSPPMLALPDTLAIAPHTDGVLLVVEAGNTRLADVERNLQNASVAGVNVLGLVLNKTTSNDVAGYYGYTYGAPANTKTFVP
ncbi:polysaccharide biosynthesis tyrosine autokinase [Deinococcus pimensis]|uniref:polysaccharide biosynthesis tyrosine autokinase n=1 Tax=Deinococcus pimensis TaxID=309888 RepID=UPI00047FC87B|nr:tyrosine-protein kinase domain-containing protein [Deinococcus pimensis]